jgi:hypothetical protein
MTAEALCIVCLSGPAAEQDFIDQQMARRYLAACFPDAEISYQMLRMRYAAERLVSASRREIGIIASPSPIR